MDITLWDYILYHLFIFLISFTAILFILFMYNEDQILGINSNNKYLIKLKIFIIKSRLYNNNRRIKNFIHSIPDINIIIDDEGNNILGYLLKKECIDTEIVQLLIDKKININKKLLQEYIDIDHRLIDRHICRYYFKIKIKDFDLYDHDIKINNISLLKNYINSCNNK